MKKNWPLVVIALIGITLGLLLGNWQRSDNPQPIAQATKPTVPTLTRLPAFSFPSPTGELLQSSQWDGKIRVVNFWATWCPPCREEMPLFVRLQQEFADQGVQFLGIAIDEARPVKTFAKLFAINFPLLMGDNEAQLLSKQLGNHFGGLPFTVIVDQQGNIVAQHTGELAEKKLRPILEKLIKPQS